MSIVYANFVVYLSFQIRFVVYFHNETTVFECIPLTGRRKPLPAAFP